MSRYNFNLQVALLVRMINPLSILARPIMHSVASNASTGQIRKPTPTASFLTVRWPLLKTTVVTLVKVGTPGATPIPQGALRSALLADHNHMH